MTNTNYISNFIKYNRSTLGMTQEELAEKAGVGLRFIRELERGKSTLRMDKVNQVLALFGFSLTPSKDLDPYEIDANNFNRKVQIYLKNKSVLYGILIETIKEGNEIKGWKFVTNNNAIEFQKTLDTKLTTIINHKDIERIENI